MSRVDTGQLLDGLTLEKLNEIFQSVIRRQEDKVDPIRSKFGKIEKEEVSLPEKMEEIEEYARTHSRFNFVICWKDRQVKYRLSSRFWQFWS